MTLSKEIVISNDFVWIFGIRFLRKGYRAARELLSEGGLMVVPSAPSLVPIGSDAYYRESLTHSDVAIADSALMVLIMKIRFGVHLQRVSGLEFLQRYLRDMVLEKETGIFLVEPTMEDHNANERYLKQIGVEYKSENYHIAPVYTDVVIRDYALLKSLENRKPPVVLINLGGGVQERLGYFLKMNLTYKPTIICTGAAIAFLSGRQVEIPMWADRLYLGWLFRCCSNPKRFVPRYVGSAKLIPMLSSCVLRTG